MIDTVQPIKKAIELRRSGNSYADIARQLKVSKTSVSNWVKNVRLTEGEKANLQKSLKIKSQRNRMMAKISLRARIVFKEKKAYEEAEESYKKNIKDPLFLFGLGLYTGKGSNRGGNIQFIHQNPQIITLMLKWTEKYLTIPKNELSYRLFVNFSQKSEENQENILFWSKNLGISSNIFSKTVYSTSAKKPKKSNDYKGSLAFTLTKVSALRTIIAWQKLTIGYHS